MRQAVDRWMRLLMDCGNSWAEVADAAEVVEAVEARL